MYEQEWLDSTKEKNAKQMRINNTIQVSNQRINSPGTQHKEPRGQSSVLIYHIFTGYTICQQQSTVFSEGIGAGQRLWTVGTRSADWVGHSGTFTITVEINKPTK